VAAAFLRDVRGAIPAAALQLALLSHILASWNPQPRRILDLGCGDGILGGYLLDRNPQTHGVFVDFSDPMLEAAGKRLEGCARALIVKADIGSSSWLEAIGDTQSFDAVVSGFVIHHQPDTRKMALYAEIFGLLSPGGIFLNLEQVASPTPAVEALHHDYFIDCVYEFQAKAGTAKSRDDVVRAYATRPTRDENILASVADQCNWLRDLGFADVDCFFKIFELAIFGGRKPVTGRSARR
jgi:ubiquinone/menaquinone biosynthesis C-methylase UbiE